MIFGRLVRLGVHRNQNFCSSLNRNWPERKLRPGLVFWFCFKPILQWEQRRSQKFARGGSTFVPDMGEGSKGVRNFWTIEGPYMQSGAMFCQFHHYHIRPVASFYLEGVRHARQDYLSGAPPSVGAERTRKFLALQTPQMAGNGTSRVF